MASKVDLNQVLELSARLRLNIRADQCICVMPPFGLYVLENYWFSQCQVLLKFDAVYSSATHTLAQDLSPHPSSSKLRL